MDLARAPRRAARKKGSGYENAGLLARLPKSPTYQNLHHPAVKKQDYF
jgi:hypothetical protein